MKVFLTTAYFYKKFNPPQWLMSSNPLVASLCTDDPDEADIIIFAEGHVATDPYFRKVINHPIYKKYPHKCVLYHDTDKCITPIPTISPSIESWQYNSKHKRSFHYFARRCENETIEQSPVKFDIDRDYLYNFIGSNNHVVRNKIINIKHPGDTYIKETSGIYAWKLDHADKLLFERDYFYAMSKSSFILTPRGIGPCSYRLFEAMQMGRTPVIISDAWVNIPNIDWESFTIRIAESNIPHIPEILLERKNEAIEMGVRARKMWEDNFSPEVSFHHLCMAASQLIKHRYSFLDSIQDYSQFFRNGWHFKNILRFKKNQIKRKFFK